MPIPQTYLWQPAPFVRLLIPLIAGIIIQWHLVLPARILATASGVGFMLPFLYTLFPIATKFRFRHLAGFVLLALIGLVGAWLVLLKDIRNNPHWIGYHQGIKYYTIVHLTEPLIQKPNTYKAMAKVDGIFNGTSSGKIDGKIIIYFKKDSSLFSLRYGSRLIIYQPFREINNPGNPGGFDYKRYALFGGITHQVYLKPGQFKILPGKAGSLLGNLLLNSKEAVISCLGNFIKSPKELGLAEALLIGYKDDLDKNLVQSYSNTGVVHIIAISGLHLGLIYLLLVQLTRPLGKSKGLSWLRFFIIILSLWGFSLIAGAQPSVLRSAVMFSCIALGELIGRKSTTYNTLALSAFMLLCINPFWLWDVGFQLSYAAVLSIVIFFRPVYNAFYIRNKALDAFWKLNAVSIAAQMLTLPIILFHFHQFPLLFLIANMVAVPLSSAILVGELLLMCLSFFTPVANGIGAVLEYTIRFMNGYIERLDEVPYAVWNGFSLSFIQVLLFYGFIAGLSYWLFQKKREALWYACACLLLLVGLRSYSFIEANRQKKLVVYNVPSYQAIDIMEGRSFTFIGDSELEKNSRLRMFYLQPARLKHRVGMRNRPIGKSFRLHHKQILVIDTGVFLEPNRIKPVVDVLILSKNPRLYMKDVYKAFTVKQVVMDASVPAWKKQLWKKDCTQLGLSYYDVTERGAFEMNLQ